MSDDGRSRRSVLRSAGLAAGSVALGAVGTASAAACDGRTETTVETGRLSGAADADTLTHRPTLSDPCELTFALSSADATDFDLYVTLDGRTPTTDDFDRKSETSFVSDERIALGADALAGADAFGVLVDSYTAGGSYRLEITETASGESAPNEPPTASFAVSPDAPTAGETVSLDASASTDPDGSIRAYEWTFGDGTTASGQTAETVYESAGDYEVALTVTDDDGATDTARQTVTVAPDDGGDCGRTVTTTETGTLAGADDADEYTYGTRTGSPCEVRLTLSADAGTDFDLYLTYDGRTPTTRNWDERSYSPDSGEEIVADPARIDADTELGVLVDSYEGAGDYELLIEEVGAGESANDAPTAAFDRSPDTPAVGETVSVDASASSDPDGSIRSYEWAFGDGTTASGETAGHAYDEPGEYELVLTVTDDDGATATARETVTVEADGGGECGAERETASATDTLYGFFGGDTYTYETRTAEPCRATVSLSGPADADFDLYLTTDGRTPTTDDYDARSASPGSEESVTLSELRSATAIGILVDPASGYGQYTVSVEELGI